MSQKEREKLPSSTWYSQFRYPQGWRGWIVGHILAINNRERSHWVLSLLDLQPQHHVLEIGFGPGVDIRRVGRCASAGFCCGCRSLRRNAPPGHTPKPARHSHWPNSTPPGRR
jgi:hypothetical protein